MADRFADPVRTRRGEIFGWFAHPRSRRPIKRCVPMKSSDENPPHLVFLEQHRGTLPEAISEADLEVLNLALGLLFSRLREARRQFTQDGDNGRLGAFTALGSLWQFVALFEKPHSETLEAPVLELLNALASLDDNAVLPILKPAPRTGRSPSSQAHLSLKGHAAATVQRLMDTGLGQSEAHALVAKTLQRLDVKADRGSGNVTTATVRNWCNEVSSDVGRKGTAATMYDKILAEDERRRFRTLSEADAVAARRLSVVSLSRWVETHFPPRKR